MALTPAEKQHRYRERKKQEAEKREREIARLIYKQPFFEYLADSGFKDAIDMSFDLAGIMPPEFEDDSDGRTATGEIEKDHAPYAPGSGSLGRAEVLISAGIDALAELAGVVSSYKKQEIESRIAELEQSDLDTKADIVRLEKMRDQLEKSVRITLPQWKVQDE